MKMLKYLFLVAFLCLLATFGAHAQISDTAADGIVTHASTVLVTVGGVVASTVGFFIIVAIVKWVRSK
jgi:hypothetical protein